MDDEKLVKVIKGLEWVLEGDRFGFGVNWYEDCVPQTEEEWAGYNITRAIELLKDQDNQIHHMGLIIEEYEKELKEQEAVEPSFKQDEKGIFVWRCGSCGAYMYHIYDGIDKAKEYAKFCRKCGKPVLWEGR